MPETVPLLQQGQCETLAELVGDVFGQPGGELGAIRECWTEASGIESAVEWWRTWRITCELGLVRRARPVLPDEQPLWHRAVEVTIPAVLDVLRGLIADNWQGKPFVRRRAWHWACAMVPPMPKSSFYLAWKQAVEQGMVVPVDGKDRWALALADAPPLEKDLGKPGKPRRRQPAEPAGAPDLPPWAPDSMKFDAEAGRPWAHLPRTPDEDDATTMAVNLIFSDGESLWRQALIDPMAQKFCPRKAGQVSMFSEKRKTCATLEDARKHDVWNGTRAANAVAAGREMGIFEPVDPEHAGLGDPHRIVPMDVSMWDKDYLAKLEREYTTKRRMVR